MPIEELMELLESTTGSLIKQYEELALDEGAYQRQFWTIWQQLPDGMSVAAMTRDCELECRVLDEARILSRSLLEGKLARRDALVAILAARAK
jgi:hypothetical protein